MMNLYNLWRVLYAASLEHAADNGPTLYHSRIDGALLPWK